MSDFDYTSAAPAALVISDRADVRADMTDDVVAAGAQLRAACSVADVLADSERVHGASLVLVDADRESNDMLGLLAILGSDANRALVVVTEAAFLDAVYASIPHGNAHIVVGQSRAERIVSLSHATLPVSQANEEPGGEEPVNELQHITAQVALIAQRLAELSGEQADYSDIGKVRSPAAGYRGADSDFELTSYMVTMVLRQRRLRDNFFDASLFADPAWDILLDMTQAHLDAKDVSVSSLCIAACVPPTTALRWIKLMSDAGLLERRADEADGRRAFIALSDEAFTAMRGYFAAVNKNAAKLSDKSG